MMWKSYLRYPYSSYQVEPQSPEGYACTAFQHWRPITEVPSRSQRGQSLIAHGAACNQLRTTEAPSLILSSHELINEYYGPECPLLSTAAFRGASFPPSLSFALNSSERNNCLWPNWKFSHHLKVLMSSYHSAGFWQITDVFLFLH